MLALAKSTRPYQKNNYKAPGLPVAHTCNPSYSGGRDQGARGSKPALANSSRDPVSKNNHQTGLVEWLKW
jgi:hypothetical protein